MGAVVDAGGAVHGLQELYVADCSIMPTIPRANTNVPAAVIGLRIGGLLCGTVTSHGGPRRDEAAGGRQGDEREATTGGRNLLFRD
jgi:choline dehydrogenase-like flavoprotein